MSRNIDLPCSSAATSGSDFGSVGVVVPEVSTGVARRRESLNSSRSGFGFLGLSVRQAKTMGRTDRKDSSPIHPDPGSDIWTERAEQLNSFRFGITFRGEINHGDERNGQRLTRRDERKKQAGRSGPCPKRQFNVLLPPSSSKTPSWNTTRLKAQFRVEGRSSLGGKNTTLDMSTVKWAGNEILKENGVGVLAGPAFFLVK
ncbi:hypothetical protein BDZ89DRAFT_1055528, partial [Hymenopellis radicata]